MLNGEQPLATDAQRLAYAQMSQLLDEQIDTRLQLLPFPSKRPPSPATAAALGMIGLTMVTHRALLA